MKINRNVLCACGSGLKYKHCCINSFVITTRSRIKTYPEKFVIGKLIKNSKTFNNFYQKEREKIKITIYWVESSSNRESFFYLPGNMNGGRHKNEYGETFIILKRIPVSLHDEILIAHELGHILLDLEKFPYIITHENQYEYIASFFSTIIHDFLIDSRLSQFGFIVKNLNFDTKRIPKKIGYPCMGETQ